MTQLPYAGSPMPDRVPIPFLKWVGGKRQLLPNIRRFVPDKIGTYYEPFVGGGAVFFELAGRGLFKRAVLADANVELVNCYQVVRDRVAPLIDRLRTYRHVLAEYYKVRDQRPVDLDEIERAARVIYLNKTGFNGLYRVNSRGLFNVPFGRYARPTICDPGRLRAASEALARAEILHLDFGELLKKFPPTTEDFVYLDPPYVPVSRTSSFTSYASREFGTGEQQRLADALRALAGAGVRALLSNSDCRETRRLYKGLLIKPVEARRSVNSVAEGRGAVGEILVRSFAYPVAGLETVTRLKRASGAARGIGSSAARRGRLPKGRRDVGVSRA
jgi:DNA adenine methylase